MNRWQIVTGQQLSMRCWDDTCVLYNDLSGDTHLLGEASMVLLQALSSGPADEEVLLRCLNDRFEFDTAADVLLAELIAGLVRLSLVEAHR